MKTTEDLAGACGFQLVVPATGRPVSGVFCGDLLSWVLAQAKQGDAWCTVMSGENTVAVAAAAECACVVLCHGAVPDEAMLARASRHDVAIFTTALPEFEAARALAGALEQ